MTPFDRWRADGREIAVIGLGKSGIAATRLLRREGLEVYASDAGTGGSQLAGSNGIVARSYPARE